MVITIFGSIANRFIKWGTIKMKNNQQSTTESYLKLYYTDHIAADRELCKTTMDKVNKTFNHTVHAESGHSDKVTRK